jgi:hypothetical protein
VDERKGGGFVSSFSLFSSLSNETLNSRETGREEKGCEPFFKKIKKFVL